METFVEGKYRIIDNFLPAEEWNYIKSHLVDLGTVKYEVMNEYKTIEQYQIVSDANKDLKYEDILKIHFVHSFYDSYAHPHKPSDEFPILKPIIDIMNPAGIQRIKANVSPSQKHKLTYPWHLDRYNMDGILTAVYYINTNNGNTILKVDDEDVVIDSVANRLVVFDGTLLHSGTTCSDQLYRSIINFVFWPHNNNDCVGIMEGQEGYR